MSSDAEEYVHRPGEGDDATADGSAGAVAADAGAGGARSEAESGASAGGFGRRGWVLVGAVFLSLLVVPGLIYAFPAAPGAAGVPFLVAMLVLPLLPAALLGATAVWSMTAATSGDDPEGDRRR
ncbi:MAG: hypothetical protein ABEH47_03320 [Haloferacaceae archaeon]